MPLVYDDEPGSWGRLSNDWPATHEHAHAKWVFANKSNQLIPYGSYVLMDSNTGHPYLRVETQEYLKKLNEHFDIVRKVILGIEIP